MVVEVGVVVVVIVVEVVALDVVGLDVEVVALEFNVVVVSSVGSSTHPVNKTSRQSRTARYGFSFKLK